MLQIFSKGVKTRDSDIRNLIRYNDLPKVYNSKNRILILKSEIDSQKITEEKIGELKVEINYAANYWGFSATDKDDWNL